MEKQQEGSRCPALRVVMMPRDTNPNGTIFGGVLLSYIDQAGAIEARKYASQRVVTVAIDRVEFTRPGHVGDVLSFYTRVLRRGRTSVTVRIEVEAERFNPPRTIEPVTVATVVYVSVDDKAQPTPLLPAAEESGDQRTGIGDQE